MGNIIDRKQKIEVPEYDYIYEDFQLVNHEKNSFGNLKIVQHKKNNKIYKAKSLNFDSSEKLDKLVTSLKQLHNKKNEYYLKVHCVKIYDNRLYCSSSNIELILDFFDNTLEDNLKSKTLFQDFSLENEVWRFIFDICRILIFEEDENIENFFVHPKSIYYDNERKKWSFIHPYYFDETNFSSAVAFSSHFCSPELYCQIKSKNQTFKIPKNSKSNIFSIALIILKCIFNEEIDITNFYKKEILSLNFNLIFEFVDKLEFKGFSLLLTNLLKDMLNELENLRISPQSILINLENFEEELISRDFKNYNKILNCYKDFKTKNDNLSFEVYENNYEPDKDISIDEKFLLEDSVDQIKKSLVIQHKSFNEKFFNDDSFENKFY